MPRPKKLRKDLSQGWREIHRAWKTGLREKIDLAHRLLREVLSKHDSPVVCWSGGKDSTVVLHLALQHVPDLPVINMSGGSTCYPAGRLLQPLFGRLERSTDGRSSERA